ncbi:MAG: BrnA antitoxin family protein [Bifidobacterium tibiigranuli]|jgi:predicted DNA binding CopG/RHH family protein|uniref:CopG family antitoxin n=1 Tax=Bifidobacterium tibiigranuli TaxID=2172043 RepID=UPI0034C61F39|nr:BrnA antitoxin family protein [Bifidobacterium tibiigranuli]MCI1712453.1 BrnA antitoxin family protein [Bifidobacterium tibiigranuli]
MRDEYDFQHSQPNPYAKKPRKAVTMRLDLDTIEYFKTQAVQTGIPYQSLINLYLAQCARERKTLEFN